MTEADKVVARTLALVDAASRHLECLRTIPELMEIHDRAEAWAGLLQLCKDGREAQNYAARVKIDCERRMGALLVEASPRGGDRKSSARPRTVDTCGLGQRQIRRLRKLAEVPDGELIAYCHTCTEEGLEVTSEGLLKHWRDVNRKANKDETVTKEVKPKPVSTEDEEPVRLDFWKSAGTCRDEVRRAARKLKDVKLVLSGLVESPYKPLLKKAAHGDTAVALAWDGEEKERALIGATMVERVYTCPAVESLTKLVAGLELLLDREADRAADATGA